MSIDPLLVRVARWRGGLGVVAALLAVATAGLPAAAEGPGQVRPGTTAAAPPTYARVETHYTVPDLSLVNTEGERTSLRSELDTATPVMLNFVFTSCTSVCPVMTAIFADVQRALGTNGDDVRLVSISLDPEFDTPAQLKAYATRFHAGPGWHWLTGKRADAIAAARAFGAWSDDKVNHAPATYLRAAPGNAWVRVDGFVSAADLVHEYHRLREGDRGRPGG